MSILGLTLYFFGIGAYVIGYRCKTSRIQMIQTQKDNWFALAAVLFLLSSVSFWASTAF